MHSTQETSKKPFFSGLPFQKICRNDTALRVAMGAIITAGAVFLILAAHQVLPAGANALSNIGVWGKVISYGALAFGVIAVTINGGKLYLSSKPSLKDSQTAEELSEETGDTKELLGEIPDELPEELSDELKEVSFGFRVLSGFHLKPRSGYIIADKVPHGEDSSFAMAKETLDAFFKDIIRNHLKGTETETEIEMTPDEIKDAIQLSEVPAGEFKIHLMPKLKHMEEVMTRLIAAMEEDSQFTAHVAEYKVRKGTKDEEGQVVIQGEVDKLGKPLPRIVLYAESREAGQAILDKVLEIFKDDHQKLGAGITPRDNEEVNSLIYWAQGSGDIKNHAEECGFALFEDMKVSLHH